jgi:hypothetical protein
MHHVTGFQAYRVWNRLLQAWKKFAPKLDFMAPTNNAEVLSTPLWWTTQFYGSNFGFTYAWAAQLARQGLYFLCDLWNQQTLFFFTWERISVQYRFGPSNQLCYNRMIVAIPPPWHELLTTTAPVSRSGEFLGIFPNPDAGAPSLLFVVQDSYRPLIGSHVTKLRIPSDTGRYLVGPRSMLLQPITSPDPITIEGQLR